MYELFGPLPRHFTSSPLPGPSYMVAALFHFSTGRSDCQSSPRARPSCLYQRRSACQLLLSICWPHAVVVWQWTKQKAAAGEHVAVSTWCLSQFARAGEQATGRKPRFAKSTEARIYAPVGGEFADLGFLPSDFLNLLEELFCDFAKNLNLPSAFAKLLELPKMFSTA